MDLEGERLSDYVEALGVPFKRLKTRKAAMRQLVLGFSWDSILRTRTLEDGKLEAYIEHLLLCSRSKWLTLHELRIFLGRMQRAAMTMPQGSKAFLGGILSMIRSLKCPMHKKRLTSATKNDLRRLARILRAN